MQKLSSDDTTFESAAPRLPSLRPNMLVLCTGSAAVMILSFSFLLWPLAIASTLLGIMMVAAADIDARTMLLPDSLTLGAVIGGLLAAFILDVDGNNQRVAIETALIKAVITALLLALGRKAYAFFRDQEGIGLGDVKLGAAIGAWLPAEQIPNCFLLASIAALIFVAFGREKMDRLSRLPFGAFLCPVLWLLVFVHYIDPI